MHQKIVDERSELLAPLTSMTSKEVKFIWTELHQKNLDLIKKVIAKETLYVISLP